MHSLNTPQLYVRSDVVDTEIQLLDLLPEGGISWVRKGEGFIAWGEVARFTSTGVNRMGDADSWWKRITAAAHVTDNVRERGSGLVAFGAFSFSANSPEGGTLIVPQVVVGSRGGRYWVTTVSDSPLPTANSDAPSGAALAQAIIDSANPSPRRDVPDLTFETPRREHWDNAVTEGVARIHAGEVDKVVLARSVHASAQAPIDERVVIDRLASRYGSCWTFSIDKWLGATPELLLRLDASLVTSRVLAGTIRPSGDETADLAHAAALARSSKDLNEHQYAVQSVTTVLHDHCASMNVPDEPSVLHLPNVMHLATDVTGVLNRASSALQLLKELHPSAAVCGTPTATAAAVIDELEGMDRGRYSGPVGWIDAAGDGEWCIGLRSARLDDDAAGITLYAGCGIVDGSQPAAEWAESEAKLEPVLHALTRP